MKHTQHPSWFNADRVAVKGSVVLEQWRKAHGPEHKRLAANIQRRSYAGAQMGRTVADWIANGTSADSELYTGLRPLRNRSRQLVRDNEYAANAIKRIIPNNVVGRGIGLQPLVKLSNGKEDAVTNAAIKKAWAKWSRAENCHTAGRMSFEDLERCVMRGVAEAGEVLVRIIRQRFGKSDVPMALELIEADQLVDNWSGRTKDGNEVRMGVEVDKWQRPVAYWFYPRHPGDFSFASTAPSNDWLRVPASEILHIGLFERPTQTRCVPWLHSVLIKLRHMGGYEEAEIVAARASASIMGFVQSPESDTPEIPGGAMDSDDVVDNEKVFDMSPGIIKELGPGETFSGFNPSRPNGALDPFMRYMLRSVAAGTGISYESLSRDYSQTTYSSGRLALLDDRDNWRVLQAWLVRTFHQHVYEAWLELAVLSGALQLRGYEQNTESYQLVRWQTRGWDWVDPLKEVMAMKAAIRSGITTQTRVLASKGEDIEEILEERRNELNLAADLDLVFDTDPAQTNDKGASQAKPESDGGPTPIDEDSATDGIAADTTGE